MLSEVYLFGFWCWEFYGVEGILFIFNCSAIRQVRDEPLHSLDVHTLSSSKVMCIHRCRECVSIILVGGSESRPNVAAEFDDGEHGNEKCVD